MNSAIIAVTKSAYATFHAPPPLAMQVAPDYFAGAIALVADSRSLAEGCTEASRERRAISTAVRGARPLANPLTATLMRRRHCDSELLFSWMRLARGLTNP